MLSSARRRRLPRRRVARSAVALSVLALVAGCASDPDDGAPTDSSTTAAGPASTISAAEESDGPAAGVPIPPTALEFEPCRGAECATVEVPVDPAQPELGTLDIAIRVRRSSAPEARLGYLLVNPGGPGGSGVEMAEFARDHVRPEVLDAFDIVGFDPRGVGASQPELTCGGRDVVREQTDRVTGPVDTPDEVLALETAVAVCAEQTGPALGYLGTEFVAHDMDAIRAALGADQISYYGESYGSTIGVFYATLYPDRVRAMVVDAAARAPTSGLGTQEERVAADLRVWTGFEELLGRALASCDSTECPIFNDGDPVGYYLDAMAKIDLVNEARPNLDGAGLLGVITFLYRESDWPELYQALFQLEENDAPSLLASSSDLQASDSDINEIDWINCLDLWSLSPEDDRATQLGDAEALAGALESAAPLLAATSPFTDQRSLCPFLDTIAPEPLDIPYDGGGVPILVIGNPSDPATPFEGSRELAEETLSNGYLLEADHPNHVVYGSENECVSDIVHRVLLAIEFPDDRRIVCERV